MLRRRLLRVNGVRLLMSCLLCLGFWQLGQGAYMPAKAWLAQEMMQRAWRKAEMGDEDTTPWPWADTYPVARMSAKNGAIELIILEGGSGQDACLRSRTSECERDARAIRQQHHRRASRYTLSVPAVSQRGRDTSHGDARRSQSPVPGIGDRCR